MHRPPGRASLSCPCIVGLKSTDRNGSWKLWEKELTKLMVSRRFVKGFVMQNMFENVYCVAGYGDGA